MRRSGPMLFLTRRRRATVAWKHQFIETLLSRALESTEFQHDCGSPSTNFLVSVLGHIEQRVQRHVGLRHRDVVINVVAVIADSMELAISSWYRQGMFARWRHVPIHIVQWNNFLNRFGFSLSFRATDLFEWIHLTARRSELRNISAHRDEADPAGRIRTVNVEIVSKRPSSNSAVVRIVNRRW